MTRALIILQRQADRERAATWAMKLPWGTRITFAQTKRTMPQNDRMWAMLTEVSRQLTWHGVKLTPDDWKLMFLAGLNQEMRMVPNIAGNGFVNLGRSSSDLTVAEMGDMMTLIEAFGAERGVTFHDGQEPEVAQQAPPVAA